MQVEIYTDGGSRNNPGRAAIGVVVKHDGIAIYSASSYLGIATNNEAEYEGFLFSLEWLLSQEQYSIESITWKLDSMLVVEQLNKKWKIKETRLLSLAQKAWDGLATLKIPYKITHIPRSENKDADTLVNLTLDSQVA